MQEDALKRVREMQSGNSNRRPQQSQQLHNENMKEEVKANEITASESKVKDPLEGLFKDKEKLLVLLLIMLLSQENSNTELVLALLYIII